MSKQPWIFTFAVGLLVGAILARWSDIASLWTHRTQISGASKVAEGLSELGL